MDKNSFVESSEKNIRDVIQAQIGGGKFCWSLESIRELLCLGLSPYCSFLFLSILVSISEYPGHCGAQYGILACQVCNKTRTVPPPPTLCCFLSPHRRHAWVDTTDFIASDFSLCGSSGGGAGDPHYPKLHVQLVDGSGKVFESNCEFNLGSDRYQKSGCE